MDSHLGLGATSLTFLGEKDLHVLQRLRSGVSLGHSEVHLNFILSLLGWFLEGLPKKQHHLLITRNVE